MTVSLAVKYEKIEMVDGYVPVADKDVATKDYVSLFSLPVGTIVPCAGAAAPSGWLLCDGASLVQADFPSLFAVIGTTFGSVDGTHFNVPDLRGRYVAGMPGGGTLGGIVGTALSDEEDRPVGQHLHSIDPPSTTSGTTNLAHTHDMNTGSGTGGTGAVQEGDPAGGTNPPTLSALGNHSHTVNIPAFDSAASGSVAGTNAPFMQLNMIIRA